MAMDRLFQLMKEKKASDMFLTVNSPIHIKINGHLLPINQQKMDPSNIQALLTEVVSPAKLQELAEHNELNIGIPVPGLGSFRLSAFRQRGNISAVFRYIPGEIPRLADLNVPPILADIVMEKRGLILVVGATGSGKSTTIAAMLDHRNITKSGHILTLEDPIEFLFTNKKSIVNQREIGIDADNLKTALRQLEQKLAEANAKTDVLIAQHRRARAVNRASNAQLQMTNNTKSGTYDRMKHKIVREEATAQATSELVADDVEMRLAALEKEDRINQLLAELKAKRGA